MAVQEEPFIRTTWQQVLLPLRTARSTMGRMHSDAQFAGSSSVPAHVAMMGYVGMGNNPMVGATVAVEEAMK